MGWLLLDGDIEEKQEATIKQQLTCAAASASPCSRKNNQPVEKEKKNNELPDKKLNHCSPILDVASGALTWCAAPPGRCLTLHPEIESTCEKPNEKQKQPLIFHMMWPCTGKRTAKQKQQYLSRAKKATPGEKQK